MATTKGFFSVVQFCPDLDRGECANIGIILVVPERGFLDVRLSKDNEGPKERFGPDGFDGTRLGIAKAGFKARVRDDGKDWRNAVDLEKFGSREGNNLIVGPPRVILVDDPKSDLDELYRRTVHLDPQHQRQCQGPT